MDFIGFIIELGILLFIVAFIAIGLVTCVAAIILTSVGIGFWTQRTLTGIVALFVQGGIFTGILLGACGAWVSCLVWPMMRDDWVALTIGGMAGGVAGLGAGLLAVFIASRIAADVWPWLREKGAKAYQGATGYFTTPSEA